jgi:DtxR family Mn-dependent transcriptional regulator
VATTAEENYLKAIFHLSGDNEKVTISRLSETLQVSKPTANSMVKNLQTQGWVKYEKYKPVLLTAKGRKTAALILRKHRLTEMYLVEKMGFGWDEVHEIAEQIEHIKSPVFFDRMDELMDFPRVDPHGSPIPDKEGLIEPTDYKPLSEMSASSVVTVSALVNSSKEFLAFLDERGIQLGSKLRIISKSDFDESVTVDLNGEKETLSAKVSRSLLVDQLK